MADDNMTAFMAGQNSMCKNNEDCWGGSWFIWIILIFALFMNNGFGRNDFDRGAMEAANQGALTRTTMFEGFNTNDLMRGQDTLVRGQYDIQREAVQNRYDLANQSNQLQREIMQNRFDAQQCCCETQKEILESRYTTQLGFQQVQAQQAQCCCDLKTAIHAEGEATRALIAANALQDVRDRLARAESERDNLAQTNVILGSLNKTPVPAYLTCSPYAATYNPYVNSGCGCSGGCQ